MSSWTNTPQTPLRGRWSRNCGSRVGSTQPSRPAPVGTERPDEVWQQLHPSAVTGRAGGAMIRGLLLDSGDTLIGPRGGRWNPRFDFEEVVAHHHPDVLASQFAESFIEGQAFMDGFAHPIPRPLPRGDPAATRHRAATRSARRVGLSASRRVADGRVRRCPTGARPDPRPGREDGRRLGQLGDAARRVSLTRAGGLLRRVRHLRGHRLQQARPSHVPRRERAPRTRPARLRVR